MLMQRIFLMLILYTCCAHYVFGQSNYTKHEVGGNVSVMGADTKGSFNNDESRDGLYGFSLQGAYNISRYWGLKGEFSYFQKHFVASGVVPTSRLTEIMGGIKLQDNSNSKRFRPFAQALIGVAHTSNLPRVLQENPKTVTLISSTGPALSLGGGLDLRLTKHLELRVVQIDYNPVWAKSQTFHNAKIGLGLNIRF